jgi:predicted DNA-binding transcriptional regulator AlpA
VEPAEYPGTPAAKLTAGYLLTDVELAALYGVSLQTVRNWRWTGEGPRWVRVGARCIRYRAADVQAFIEGQGQAA